MTEQNDCHVRKRPEFAALAEEAHLWVVATDTPPEPTAVKRFSNMLSSEERDRHNQFHFKKDRNLFLVSHALVRTALSQYCDVPPQNWKFVATQWGRPEIANPWALSLGLKFNLTHTDGLVAFVVTRGSDCGVDAERQRAISDLDDLAKRIFHPREFEIFLTTPEPKRLEKFLAFWTTKEACMKACGRGFSLAPESFALELMEDDMNARCLEAPDSLNWKIQRFHPTPEHQLAVAIDSSAPRRIVARYLNVNFDRSDF